jgi:hypothetical protein
MTLRRELAAVAAALVADSGLDYGAAKRRAARHLGLMDSPPRGAMPDNDEIDEALREHLDLFDADGHRQRRASLRLAAIELMGELAAWSPLVTGAAWKGLVTEHAVLHLQIADGHAKEVAIDLINRGLDFDATETTGTGGRGRIEVLVGHWREWPVMIAMHPIHDLRGASRDDSQRGAERGHRNQLIERLRAECLREIKRCWMGCTADECAGYLGETILSIRPRFSELRAFGLIEDTGDRRLNDSGRRATVWRATR